MGGAHLTSGQRARGQGGHSPASLRQAVLSMITGCCFGILLFKTYLLRSGVGGHSVFNIYWDRSGKEGQGGTVVLRTYLLMSGWVQGGQTICCNTGAAAAAAGAAGQPQLDLFFLQRSQTDRNPSFLNERPPRYVPKPNPTPRINTANAKRILGVNLIGITEAICLLLHRVWTFLYTPTLPRNRRTSSLLRNTRI